jgi:hypothetical protein
VPAGACLVEYGAVEADVALVEWRRATRLQTTARQQVQARLSPACRPDDPDFTGSHPVPTALSRLFSKTPSRRNDRASRCGDWVLDHWRGGSFPGASKKPNDLAEGVARRRRVALPVLSCDLAGPTFDSHTTQLSNAAFARRVAPVIALLPEAEDFVAAERARHWLPAAPNPLRVSAYAELLVWRSAWNTTAS